MAGRRRRGPGEGSIYRRKNGIWAGDVQLGVDENGRRKRRTVYGKSRGEVLRKVDELRAQAVRGFIVDPGTLKVGGFLERWLRDTAGPRVRPSTARHYEYALKRVRAHLGGVPLRSLSPLHLQALQRSLEETGVSPRGRQMTHTVLSIALRDAVRMRLLPYSPAEAVKRPRAPRPEIRALDREQVRRLLEAAKDEPLEALYAVAVTSGLRLGELLGLRWGDLDLESNAVHVRRAMTEDANGAPTFAEPKTARSRRKVNLTALAAAAIHTHRERLGAFPHPERLLFADSQGGPIRRPNFYRRSWKPLLRRAGLPDLPFHSLRHTAATLMLAAGVHPKVVQECLGHSTITLTLDTYSHAVPTLGREAADRLDALLGS